MLALCRKQETIDALFTNAPDRLDGFIRVSDLAELLYALSSFTARPGRVWFDSAYALLLRLKRWAVLACVSQWLEQKCMRCTCSDMTCVHLVAF